MQPTIGTISVTQRPGPCGLVYQTYRWEGGRHVTLSRALLESLDQPTALGATACVGPYQVRIIDVNILADTVVAVPEDRWAWADLLASLAGECLGLTYYRLIMTAGVWGLADWQLDRLPSWRDLYIVRWAARRLRKGA